MDRHKESRTVDDWDRRLDLIDMTKPCIELTAADYVLSTLPHTALDPKHANLRLQKDTKCSA